MSKVLATIDVDADFAYELEEAKLGNLYTEEAYVYFQRLQFKNLLNRFDVQSENSIEDAFVIAVGKEEIQKIFAEAEKRRQWEPFFTKTPEMYFRCLQEMLR